MIKACAAGNWADPETELVTHQTTRRGPDSSFAAVQLMNFHVMGTMPALTSAIRENAEVERSRLPGLHSGQYLSETGAVSASTCGIRGILETYLVRDLHVNGALRPFDTKASATLS